MAHYEDAAQSIAERARDAGLVNDSNTFYNTLLERAEYARSLAGGKDTAARIAKLPARLGNSWEGRNGNLVFAIIRHDNVVTIELRRDNQDCRAGAFGCQQVRTIA